MFVQTTLGICEWLVLWYLLMPKSAKPSYNGIVLWLERQVSPVGSCLWPLDFHPFRKEPLGGEAMLEEVSHGDQAVLDSLAPFLVYSLLQVWMQCHLLVPSSCHHAFHACCCAFPAGMDYSSTTVSRKPTLAPLSWFLRVFHHSNRKLRHTHSIFL